MRIRLGGCFVFVVCKIQTKAGNCINYRGGWFAFHAFKTCGLANTGEH